MESAKDAPIDAVLSRLRDDLGNRAFDVVDHWDADRCAVGIARPDDHRFLVYISTFFSPPGQYSYQCERPASDDKRPYDADAMVDNAAYAELLEAVRAHLVP